MRRAADPDGGGLRGHHHQQVELHHKVPAQQVINLASWGCVSEHDDTFRNFIFAVLFLAQPFLHDGVLCMSSYAVDCE